MCARCDAIVTHDRLVADAVVDVDDCCSMLMLCISTLQPPIYSIYVHVIFTA